MKFALIALMVIQLCKQLSSAFDEYILYTDNFFTSTKLFKTLRTFDIDACDIAKSGSEYSFSLFAIRDVITKKNNWGLKTHTVMNEVLCMIWVDFNTMQLMTIVYNISDIKTSYFLSFRRRHDISENSVIFVSSVYLSFIATHSLIRSTETDLSISYSIRRYNQYMNDSNENAQQRAVYFFNRRSFRYWWLLFIFFHDVACLNAYIIYKTCDLENEHLCRENFIRKIATSLIEKNADCERKRSSHVADILVNDSTSESEHRWVRLKKRRYCDVCRNDKNTSFKRKRESLTEMNFNAQKRRKREAQTSWDWLDLKMSEEDRL